MRRMRLATQSPDQNEAPRHVRGALGIPRRWRRQGRLRRCAPAAPGFRPALPLERIRSLELTDEAFTVDPGFDPKRYEAETFGVTWGEKPMTVVVRFRADQRRTSASGSGTRRSGSGRSRTAGWK